jgi:tetratricopeptide (TPR) repeat protein
MMTPYDKEFIIRYVDDELSAEERRQFEADLQMDPSLAAEVALYKEVKATLQQRLPQDAGSEALRNTLRELNKDYFGVPARARQVPMIRWLAGMAAAASVIIATILLWPSGKEDYLDRLGRTEMISTTERGGNADSLLQQASVFFNQQEFSKALPLLDKAVKEDSTSQLALFYRGVSEWHTGDVDAARKDLGRVYDGGSLLQYEAAFYIALSYAGQKNNPAAKEWLKKIPEGSPVTEKAKELSSRLK